MDNFEAIEVFFGKNPHHHISFALLIRAVPLPGKAREE
jgi:hypothetical protein